MSCEQTSLFDDARRIARALIDYQGKSIQGVEYVEILDHDTPPYKPQGNEAGQSLRWRIVLIHCLMPFSDISNVDVHLEGGPESAPPQVQWIHLASQLPAPLHVVEDHRGTTRELTDTERAFFENLANSDHILVVHILPFIAPVEDESSYTLRLSLGDDAIPDPRLQTATFSYHAEGPVDIDCTPVQSLVRQRPPTPPLDYLARDFASFRRLLLDRMAVVMPEWSERTVADIGVALVELLAYVGDHLSYYQDAAATEAYLGTARRRISVRRHARLLDYALHEGNNSRVWICLEVNTEYDPDGPVYLESPRTVPAGTQLITRLEHEQDTALTNDVLEDALTENALFFETLYPVQPLPIRNCIAVYDWGGGASCVPRGATKAVLDGNASALALKAGDVLIFEEIDDHVSGNLADSTRRHAVCLISDGLSLHDELNNKDVTEITWHQDDALPFALPIRHPSGAQAAIVRGNVVIADHGRTVTEALVPEMASADERYRPQFVGSNVTHQVPIDVEALQATSASAQLVQDPRKALPAALVLEVEEDEAVSMTYTRWYPRRDLLASGPFDHHVAIEVERGGRAQVRFGDNVNGRRPSAGTRWHARYRLGNGTAGNVGAEAITHVLVPDDQSQRSTLMRYGIERVRNPLPAVGGTEPERDQQARLYAPYTFREGERAVTADDYAAVTERHPEVQKAVAQIRWTGSWNTVFVVVDRRGGLPIDMDFEAELRTFLEPFRMAGQDLEFEPPRFVPLDIAFTVHVAPDYLQSEVKSAVLEALGSGESANGKRGFFHPDNFTFGDPVYLSNILTSAMEVAGVVWIDFDDTNGKPNRFQRLGEDPDGEVGEGLIAVAPLEIIRVDNDPKAPQNGRLRLYMEGGL